MSKKSKWIEIKSKSDLPRPGRMVMIHERDGRMIPATRRRPEWGGDYEFMAQLSQCGGSYDRYPTDDVTHWRPMPSKPRNIKV